MDLDLGDLGDLDSLGDFDLNESENPYEYQNRYIEPPAVTNLPEEYLKIEYADQLAEKLDLSQEGKRYFVVVNGSFVFGDFIESLAMVKELHIKRLTISTLGLSENNVDSLANLLRYGIADEINLIVSIYFYGHERHNLIPYIYRELDNPEYGGKFQLAVAGTHMKTVTIETHAGQFIVIHGSANLRSSGNLEQFTIEVNKTLYDFTTDIENRILAKYNTIKKAIRHKTLWHLTATTAPKESRPERERPAPPN